MPNYGPCGNILPGQAPLSSQVSLRVAGTHIPSNTNNNFKYPISLDPFSRDPPSDPPGIRFPTSTTNSSNISNSQATTTSVSFNVINSETRYLTNTRNVLSQLNLRDNIYHSKLNFFNISEPDRLREPRFVPNVYRLDIFSNTVTEEVAHVIRSSTTTLPWSETMVLRLTLRNLESSLNRDLLRSISSLRNSAGELIDKDTFLEAFRKHLLSGTLDSLDPSYYSQLANQQLGRPINVYSVPTNDQTRKRVALAKLMLDAQSKIPDHYPPQIATSIRRQRSLNEDIDTRLCIKGISSDENIEISNFGICIKTLAGPTYEVVNGPGYGYYLYLNIENGECHPIYYDTNILNAIIPSPESRYAALKIAGVDPEIKITAESDSSTHEFAENQDFGNIEFSPLYFKLNISSIEVDSPYDLLVNEITATYNVISDQDEINRHTDDHALSITKVYIDYRDPLYKYAKEGSLISIKQYDLGLRSIESEETPEEKIFPKNIPFGIILVPSNGSKYNPFNAVSQITSFSNTIKRTLSVTPSINPENIGGGSSPLKLTKLYSLGLDRVGVGEPVDIEGGTYRYDSSDDSLVNTFYKDRKYVSSIEPLESFGTAHMVKDVLDYLIGEYNPEDLRWYDIYRRLPLSRFGELIYDNTPEIMSEIKNGYRNGIKIKDVLDRYDAESKVIEDDEKVIIKYNNR